MKTPVSFGLLFLPSLMELKDLFTKNKIILHRNRAATLYFKLFRSYVDYVEKKKDTLLYIQSPRGNSVRVPNLICTAPGALSCFIVSKFYFRVYCFPIGSGIP